MLKQVRHLVAFAGVAFACFTAALLSSAVVHAASLEKIEVGSHLGEPFYAEVPLKLEAGESVTRLFIEIAAPADYKIFEVYRDPVLSSIRADVASDKRGARVKLSSRTSIKAPFFNLVLKVRYGRVAHFKKFAVFLEPPKSIQTAAQKAPQPTVQAIEQTSVVDSASVADSSDTDSSSEAEASATTEADASFDGWARTDRYGPIVYGDMLSTVAARLRLDKRYKPSQVMAALFEKNKDKFDSENMNMLKAGSFLDVPTAAEVEQRSAKEAYTLFANHEKQWKELTQKPRYAAVAEAQRTRYSKRVSIGGQAKGAASAPVMAAVSPVTDLMTDQPVNVGDLPAEAVSTIADSSDNTAGTTADEKMAGASLDAQANPVLAELQAKNEALQQQLLANQKSVEAMNAKLDEVASAAAAASTARIEKLEVLLVRMQAELEKANRQTSSPQQGPDWIIWLLAALVIILLGTVAVLMRREPAHPADAAKVEETAESAAEAVAVTDEPVATQTPDEVEEQEEDVFDSISSFSDDLTDTDTAEMEAFDASLLDEDPNPNVDYLSEADVYIRYGMDDEALHQLNLALRLQPDHLEAHIKKAQLLRRTGSMAAFNEAKVDAGSILESSDLDQFNVALHEVATESDDEAVEPSVSEHPDKEDSSSDLLLAGAVGVAAGVMLADTDDDSGIDFDLSDVDVSDQQDEDAQEAAMEEMDWLHDDSFEAEPESPAGESPVQTESGDESDKSTDAGEAGVTQMFDNLMGEFSDDEQEVSLDSSDVATVESSQSDARAETSADELTLDLASGDATQELDNLLSEFTDQDESLEDDRDADAAIADRTLLIDDEMAGIEDLDHLLGDFSDDDEVFDFSAETSELDASVFEQAEEAVGRQVDDGDATLGATQHLDILMSEFSESPDADSEATGLDDDLLEKAGNVSSDAIDVEENHDATQELSHLLSAFSEDEAEAASAEVDPQGTYAASNAVEIDHDATQELDNLLSEFAADEDDNDAAGDSSEVHKEGGIDTHHGTTQELDQLLSEFSDEDEDDDHKKG